MLFTFNNIMAFEIKQTVDVPKIEKIQSHKKAETVGSVLSAINKVECSKERSEDCEQEVIEEKEK